MVRLAVRCRQRERALQFVALPVLEKHAAPTVMLRDVRRAYVALEMVIGDGGDDDGDRRRRTTAAPWCDGRALPCDTASPLPSVRPRPSRP